MTAPSRSRARSPARPLPADDRSTGAVYYDVLGLTMAAYSTRAARGLALFALLAAGATIAWAVRRRSLSLRHTVGAFGWTLLAVLASLLAAMGGAALVSLGLGRPHGWFSAPGLVPLAFGAPAAAGAIGVHALWRRRALRSHSAQAQIRAALAGGVLFWSLLLALTAANNVGAGYLALFWVGGGTLALLAWLRAPRLQLAIALGCLTPAILLTLQLAVGFLSYFIPITGMLGAGPIDVVIAALVAAVVATIATLALPLLHASGGFGRAAMALAAPGRRGSDGDRRALPLHRDPPQARQRLPRRRRRPGCDSNQGRPVHP